MSRKLRRALRELFVGLRFDSLDLNRLIRSSTTSFTIIYRELGIFLVSARQWHSFYSFYILRSYVVHESHHMTSNRCHKATKMILKHNANLSISSPYVWISPWIIIPTLSLRKLTKINFRHMSSADLALLDGYNCAEMWRRRRANGRMSTFDDLKYRFGGSVAQWRGVIIEFAHATVAKCSHPPQNQQSESIAQPVLNTGWSYCPEKSAWSCHTTFDISLPYCYMVGWYASSAVWMSVSGSFCASFVDLC